MKREEAIKIVKENMHLSYDDGKMFEALKILVPELKESEDERIRKELLGGLMWQRDNLNANGRHDDNLILPGFTMRVGDLLAYLEKQKEKYSPLCNTVKDKIREYIANHFITDTVVKTDVKSIVKAMEEGVRLGKEEQKTVEWSEEDERAIDRACVALRAYSNGDLPEFLPSELLYYADRLQSLHPQPKQEWSEEDEEHLDSIIESYKELLKDYAANNDVYYIPYNSPVVTRTVLNDIKFLKSLPERFNLQPEQEWNEEDEQYLLVCKNALNKYQRSDHWDANIISKWLENRLKSLRSQPKQERSEKDEKPLKRYNGSD